MCYVEERKQIEKIIIKNLTSNNHSKIYNLYKNEKGEILAYSPYQLAEKTNQEVPLHVRYHYNNLSKKIHLDAACSVRSEIEQEIEKILPNITEFLTFEFYNIILTTSHEQIIKYCKNNKIKILSKDKFNYLKKLMRKWKEESKQVHFRMTKQQKRKLKKLYKNTINCNKNRIV